MKRTTLTNYFKTYRTRLGLSQKQMAVVLGKDISYISRLEKGLKKPSLYAVTTYSVLCGVGIEKLIPQFFHETYQLLENSIEEHDCMFKDKNLLASINQRLNGSSNDSLIKQDYDG